MRFPFLSAAATSCLLYFSAGSAHAEPAPPSQDNVIGIGDSPLKAPLTADFSPGTIFTMEGWIYLTARQPFGWLMGKCLATGGTDPFVSFSLQLDSVTGDKLLFAYSTGAAGSYRTITNTVAIPLRTWTHVAAVMDGVVTRLIINGVVTATGTASGAPPAPAGVPFGVGVAYFANGSRNYSPFPGYARQLRIWNVARTAAQITAALGESLPTDRTGLVAAWPLDESAGTTARDASGNGRSLTVADGALATANAAMLGAGPFFADTTTAVTNGSMNDLANVGAVIDFDSDGDLDVVCFQLSWPPTIPGTGTRLRAFRNNGGTLVDVTDAVLGNVTMVHPRHSFVGDFNGDGRPDLLVVGHGADTPPFPGEQSKLLIQTADGRLVDETATRLPQHSSFTHNVAVADIDGDGDLDIYMANLGGDQSGGGGTGPRFYLNDGKGFFAEDTSRIPADIAGGVPNSVFTSALLLDVNGDGRPDLVLGGNNSTDRNEVLFNDGTAHFRRDSRFALPPKLFPGSGESVAISSADLNSDGFPDLVICTGGGFGPFANTGRTLAGYTIPGLQILLNRGDGTFRDVTSTSGITFNSSENWVVWAHLVDFNGDGRPDIVAQMSGEGSSKPRLFLNLGGTQSVQFLDVTATYGFPDRDARFVQAGDFDRDGKMDLITASPTNVTIARGLKSIDLGRIANLSVRSQAGTGDQTLITGFALSGAGTKPLLVRVIGPTLSVFGVPGTLADPAVEVAPLGGTKLTENNDWGGTTALKNAFASVGAFALSPDTTKDAALVFSPAAGAYTAKVTGANNTTGVALVEVYDAGTGNTPRLVNASARSQVGTGGDVLIAGFVVNGTLPKKLLIRASGPSLAAFGVGGTLVDPVLTVRPLGSDTIVASNDDWAGTATLKAAFTSVGAFAFASDTSKDAALAVELPPGAYTATVAGKNNTTGIALVEVYELP